MGEIVRWPGHARALRAARAAKDANRSAVTGMRRAVGVANINDHHSDGMRSRCHHLRTAVTGAPMSDARPSNEGQSDITERNESISGMDRFLGHLVLNNKANLSRDCEYPFGENPEMGQKLSKTEEKRRFIERTKQARAARYETQKEMLVILELDQGTYKQYETRTPLPYRYIPKFCAATGISMEWLLTGEGRGPIDLPKASTERPRKGRKVA